ncbi:Galactose/lactose metabolism regulatory protein GAL80 [Trichoderma lentiforme]|uniref:Galactose/lactose metabolism regulatory protein GAL80 n=1 Tax=Trichoderma lentiforme TaxID=1567552 RepID=A0A9P4XG66_9HYPO|nr:Galactose/lactose metabolism regulatory protein GAL80 [Trichoderma lentiforme]
MPIRVGLVGLGIPGSGRGGSGIWGYAAHLPSIISSSQYQLTAVCNSSIVSAEKSIAFHELSPGTKAYGSVDDLANDPDVDMIVVSVRVEKHQELMKTAILSKKDVYLEWPAGNTTAVTAELTSLAKENQVKTIVGLQMRADPLIIKLRDVIQSGKIGKVNSTSVLGFFARLGQGQWAESAAYYLDAESGGNSLYIYFAHFFDTFIHVLGDFIELHPIAKAFQKTINLVDGDGNVVKRNHPMTTPDHILIQGVLRNGTLASIAFRSPPCTVDGIGYRWTISGTEGEIELTMPEGPWQFGTAGAKVKVKVYKSNSIGTDDFDRGDISALSGGVPFPGSITAMSYKAFAAGESDKFATLESALQTKHTLDKILSALRP